jgi:hypothetical protein
MKYAMLLKIMQKKQLHCLLDFLSGKHALVSKTQEHECAYVQQHDGCDQFTFVYFWNLNNKLHRKTLVIL